MLNWIVSVRHTAQKWYSPHTTVRMLTATAFSLFTDLQTATVFIIATVYYTRTDAVLSIENLIFNHDVIFPLHF